MLFTDSDIIGQTDLVQIDSEVPGVAATAKPLIVVDGPGSVVRVAWTECGQRILAAMQTYVSYPAQTGIPANHIAAVRNTGIPSQTQPRVRLNQIVAHEWNYGNMRSPVGTWLAYMALATFYRDASSRMGQDRYEEKYKRYLADADRTWRILRQNGLPMVYQPLEAPGATHGFNPGTWDDSNVTAVSAGGAQGGTFSVAITYYDSSKYASQAAKGNGESAPSAVLEHVLAAGTALSVDITSLNPPTGTADPVGLSQGSWSPLTATHWNLWAGSGGGSLYLQKEGIPIATKQWSLAADPVLSGTVLGSGQYPDIPLTFLNIGMRA